MLSQVSMMAGAQPASASGRQDVPSRNRSDSPAGEAFVELVAVQKTYDGASLVVEDLNMQVARNEFLTMLGPSGSGKTTSLMMLAGLERPTSGHIYVGGSPIDDLPPHKRNFGMVFQNYALFPTMTVAENLAFPLEVRKMARAEIRQRVEKALQVVRLGGLENRKPAQLSGGQQQRVALARALIFEPKVVLMDEPLGALDKQLREQLQMEIKNTHDRFGVTTVYVTHDQSEAMAISDRIAVFNNGRIQQIGTAVDLYERPSNSFVASFVGENNRLLGKIVDVQGEQVIAQLNDGTRVHALSVNHGADRTSISIRPERVRIGGAAPNSDNSFSGQILQTIFLGDHFRVRLAFAGRDDFFSKVPITYAHDSLEPGTQVTISWDKRDCRALDV